MREAGDEGGDAGGGDAGGTTLLNTSQPTADTAAGGNWYDSLGEEYRSNENITQHGSMDDLAKAHINAQSLIGKKGVIVPGENATPEEMASFYNDLGRPEAAEGYEFAEMSQEVADLYGLGEEDITAYKAKFHELGLNPDQASKIWDFAMERSGGSLDQIAEGAQQANIESIETLKAEWGDQMDNNLAKANKVMADFKLAEMVDAHGLHNSPAFIAMLAKVSDSLAPDNGQGIMTNQNPTGSSPTSKADAVHALNEAKRNNDYQGIKKAQAALSSAYGV